MTKLRNRLSILNNPSAENSAVSAGDASPVSRRGFLKTLGAASALGAAGCADSARQKIYPDLEGDVDRIPGVASWFSSTCTECPSACGILVKNREGRVIKVEGNPRNPINRGGLCAVGHSSLQNLYDPDRVRQPLEAVSEDGKKVFKPISWKKAIAKVAKALKDEKGKKFFISNPVTGSEQTLLENWCKQFTVEHAAYALNEEVALAQASEHAFGEYGIPRYDFKTPEVILSIGADFLETWVSPVEFAKDWASGRRSKNPTKFVHIEPRMSLTASNADEWLKNRPGSEQALLLAVLQMLLNQGAGTNVSGALRSKIEALVAEGDNTQRAAEAGISYDRLVKLVYDLKKSKSSLVVAGGTALASETAVQTHFLAHLVNILLGNVGKTVKIGAMRKPQSDVSAIESMITEMNKKAGAVGVVFFKDANPVFSLPEEYGIKYGLKRVPLKVSFSSHLDETTAQADLILPSHTSLERWGDVMPFAGVYALQQPAMPPVFDTQQFGDSLLQIAEKASVTVAEEATYVEYLKKQWEKTLYAEYGRGAKDFDEFWRQSVERGGVFDEVKMNASAAFRTADSGFALNFTGNQSEGAQKEGLLLYPYRTVKNFDGSQANRSWLQELPDPMTKAVWDTWAEVHPSTAARYGLQSGDTVQLTNKNGQLNVPVYLNKYVHPEVVAVPLGNGHEAYGRYAQSVGEGNPLALLGAVAGAKSLSLLSGRVKLRRGNAKADLVTTQESFTQGFRHIAKTKFIKEGASVDGHGYGHGGGHHGHHEPEQMYLQRVHPVYQWGMAIDLAACTGCSACVVACYSENNIPTVGKKVAGQGREMSWLRLEKYVEETVDGVPVVSHFPMMCQHCQNAPCEPVCPVFATYHNEQGLNAMVYNRCVGTRYCGNNCSYKVRRFNWFEYDWPEPLNWQLNPDVTKRTAGVMEKCTFCVQRINEGVYQAKNQGRAVKDGEIQPACVQSCPTDALTFGNLKDENARVSKLQANQRAYKVLDHHINTQPSVAYLEDVKYRV